MVLVPNPVFCKNALLFWKTAKALVELCLNTFVHFQAFQNHRLEEETIDFMLKSFCIRNYSNLININVNIGTNTKLLLLT